MVINANALMREMKQAFKGGGYTVICDPRGTTIICCSHWAVEIDNADVPRQALSLMALHMGFLPEEGDAYKVIKGKDEPVVQTRIYEEAIAPIRGLDAAAAIETSSAAVVVKTTLIYDNCNVWQGAAEDKTVLLVNPALEGILTRKRGSIVRRAGNALCLKGEVSKAYIIGDVPHEQKLYMDHLAAIRWPVEK